jgi:hypothetical protein
VLLELEWVLRGAYRLGVDQVVRAFESLLSVRPLHFEQETMVREALQRHRQGNARGFLAPLPKQPQSATSGLRAMARFEAGWMRAALRTLLDRSSRPIRYHSGAIQRPIMDNAQGVSRSGGTRPVLPRSYRFTPAQADGAECLTALR